MNNGRIARLGRRGVVAVAGEQALPFLNDLVTADISAAGNGRAVYAGLLTPQGKVLFDFIIFREGDAFLFDLPRAGVADFIKRVMIYRLRAKVTIADRSTDSQVLAAWGPEDPVFDNWTAAPDPRLAALGWRALAPVGAPLPASFSEATEAEYDAHRIVLGVPEGGIDFAYGDVFPHDVNMDQLGGVDFSKGCYVGQEVVSRMEHRGTARRRIVITLAGTLPAAGASVNAGERVVGTVMSSANGRGLAMVRLDRAKEAMDTGLALTAGNATVTLALPAWAKFGWPAATVKDD
jgi:folate-binding protein YgfZ